MSKKTMDANLKISIAVTLCFLIAGSFIYVVRNLSYSKDVILQKANGYYYNEKYFMAAKYYAKAAELGSYGSDMYRNYADSLIRLSNYDAAIKYLKLSESLDPYNSETYYSIGNAYYQKAVAVNSAEKFVLAVEALEKAATLSPETEKIYLLIGLCYRSIGMQENARTWYRRALLSGNFSQAGFYNLIGHTFREEERYREAAGYYKRATESDYSFVAAYCNKGDMCLKLNDTQQALIDYRKAIEVNEDYIVPYIKIGSLYSEQNDYDEAIPWFIKALDINPDSDRANYLLGIAFKHLGRNNDAIEYLKKAAYCGSDEALYELRNSGIELR